MKYYWRVKRKGRWSWIPAKWVEVKNLEPVAEIQAGVNSNVSVKLYEEIE